RGNNLEEDASSAILVFLPGWGEISNAAKLLTAYNQSSDAVSPLHVCMAHSSLTPTQQFKIFEKAPKGLRKVVLATDIAESSITIPDVRFVVDAAAVRCILSSEAT